MALDRAIAQLDALISKLSAQDPGARASANGHDHTQTTGAPQPAAPPTVPEAPSAAPASAPADGTTEQPPPPAAQPKAKKAKPAKQAAPEPAADSGAGLFARAQLRVARVLTVEEINSDKLFKATIDAGGGEVRQVVAGLKGHIERGALLGSLVVAILNLKPAKLAGELSEAMLLAADAPGAGGKELVRTLIPPEGSEVGDAVYLEGSSPAGEYPKVLKSDPWKKIVAALSVQSGKATFEGTALRTDKGVVRLPDEMPDGAGIH